MKKPIVSIIVPIYNVEKYLRRCLDSIAAQTFTEWEAICVNDGSPDGCDKILAEYAARDKRFKILDKKNGGVSAARNDGVCLARGKYILFVDSDDFIHPQTLEITLHIARQANVDLVSFRHDTHVYKQILNRIRHGIDVFPDIVYKQYNISHVKFKYTDRLMDYATERNHTMNRWCVCHCYPVMHLYRRDLIKNIKFDTHIKISEDFPFWTAVLFSRPRAAITRIPLYYYIPNCASALNSARAYRVAQHIGMAIISSYNIVCKNATQCEMQRWKYNFLWPFIFICVRAFRQIDNVRDRKVVVNLLRKMNAMGIFNAPTGMRARKYNRRIDEIIKK